MVNTIPVLRYIPEWFPGAAWKREASKWRQEKEKLTDEVYAIGLENMKKSGITHPIAGSMQTQALNLGL
ncbi:hypothetical protein B0J17DRAFT_288708 [Rhizoctonia solani]|nr:hypothetical protein B0J17DRAFT_288708 [Rhizoctonia solani]